MIGGLVHPNVSRVLLLSLLFYKEDREKFPILLAFV